ncbi:MAG: hypothetical protein AAB592_05680 [Patescibacteria group bacterium]
MKKQKKQTSIAGENHSRFDASVIEWSAPEYHRYEKGVLWYVIAAVLLTGIVFYAISTGGWTFAVAILVFAGVYALIYHKEPKRLNMQLSNVGI